MLGGEGLKRPRARLGCSAVGEEMGNCGDLQLLHVCGFIVPRTSVCDCLT